MKKLISVVMALFMIFSSFGVCVGTFAADENAPTVISEADTQQETSNGLAAFFEELFAKIKKVILIFVGNISILIDGRYSKLDYSVYSTDAFELPGLDEGFVPQGICYVEILDCFAVSGYVKGENSRIYLIDKETGEAKEIVLKDFIKHAGGIASDGEDVWVCAGGSDTEGGFVYHLSASALDKADDGAEIVFDGSFQTQVRASTVCCDGERLYVAEFYEEDDYPVNPDHSFPGNDNKAWSVGYELPIEPEEYDGSEKAPDIILSIPEKVQGMAVTSGGNIIFSTSYGRFYDSTLHIYKPLDEWTQGGKVVDGEAVHLCVADDGSLVSKVKMPTLMEGIDVNGDTLYAVFESGATAYADAKEINSDAKAVKIDELIAML